MEEGDEGEEGGEGPTTPKRHRHHGRRHLKRRQIMVRLERCRAGERADGRHLIVGGQRRVDKDRQLALQLTHTGRRDALKGVGGLSADAPATWSESMVAGKRGCTGMAL